LCRECNRVRAIAKFDEKMAEMAVNLDRNGEKISVFKSLYANVGLKGCGKASGAV
jgi:hypothetical protein